MPRTKIRAKNALFDDAQKKMFRELLTTFKNEVEEEGLALKENITMVFDNFYHKAIEEVGSDIANKTIGELRRMSVLPLNAAPAINITSKVSFLGNDKTVSKTKNTIQRSSSFDEGYSTTESQYSVSSTSSTRGRPKGSKLLPQKRASRSLSRNKTSNVDWKTPLQKRTPPDSYGVITPKCKPNTPQVLLRRVKKGEMVLSLQGSPILTNPVPIEDMANINIPLNNGTLLSLQPQQGLRLSQIPDFDADTRRQLQTLNQHIETILKLDKCVQ